jgi:hypothetical protein
MQHSHLYKRCAKEMNYCSNTALPVGYVLHRYGEGDIIIVELQFSPNMKGDSLLRYGS